jgi:hypothetical protein
MIRSLRRLAPLGIAVILALALAHNSRSETFRFPGRFTSIQKTIQVASDRDTILVSPGTYYETLNYLGIQVMVLSEFGPQVTTLIPADQFGPLGTWISGETRDAVLDGFTITGYNVNSPGDTVAMFEMNKLSSPLIKNCIIRDNHGVTIARIMDDGPAFIRCQFYNNSGGPVMAIYGGTVSLLNCTIDRCEFGVYAYNADVEVRNSIISNCTGYAARGKISQFDYNNVWNNVVGLDSGARSGLHDISADPRYIDGLGGDYRLLAGSLCINSGDPNSFFNDPDGTRADMGAIPYQAMTDVEESDQLPTGFSLSQNYPNPFNPTTHIAFSLPHRTAVHLEVYNVLGQQIRKLLDNDLPTGDHVVEWDGQTDAHQPVSSGVYFYRLVTDEFASVRQMVLVK